MRILCVINNLYSGGAQRQLIGLAIEFKRAGHDVSFLVYENTDDYLYFLKEHNIKYTCLEPCSNLQRILRVRKFIRTNKYNFVLSFLETPNFLCELAALPFKKWKLIVGERNSNPEILKSKKSLLFRWLHFFADYVVSNSNENIRMVKKLNPFLPNDKLKVIYNLIDLEKWQPGVDELDSSKFRIVIAASHLYSKNLNGLLDAILLLNEKERKRLIIDWFGSKGNDDSLDIARNKIQKYSFELGTCINIKGKTLNIADEMRTAHCIGLFSFYEGLPNAVCEAMTLGKPVIASNVSDNSLLLSPDCLCNPESPESIASRITYIMNLSEKELIKIGCENRAKSLSLFNKDNIASSYINLINK